LFKTTASELEEKKLIVGNRAVKRWDEEANEAMGVRRKAPARYTSSKTTAGWEDYATAMNRKKLKEMVGEEEEGDTDSCRISKRVDTLTL